MCISVKFTQVLDQLFDFKVDRFINLGRKWYANWKIRQLNQIEIEFGSEWMNKTLSTNEHANAMQMKWQKKKRTEAGGVGLPGSRVNLLPCHLTLPKLSWLLLLTRTEIYPPGTVAHTPSPCPSPACHHGHSYSFASALINLRVTSWLTFEIDF